jgi:hypothetical protein
MDSREFGPYLARFGYGLNVAGIQMDPMPTPEHPNDDVMATPFQKPCQSELLEFSIAAGDCGVSRHVGAVSRPSLLGSGAASLPRGTKGPATPAFVAAAFLGRPLRFRYHPDACCSRLSLALSSKGQRASFSPSPRRYVAAGLQTGPSRFCASDLAFTLLAPNFEGSFEGTPPFDSRPPSPFFISVHSKES